MSPPANVPPSRLLSLPSELRRQIFRLSLTAPKNQYFQKNRVVVDVVMGGLGSAYWGTKAMSSLLRVNRQVHTEAENILYKDSIFRFAPSVTIAGLKKWSDRLNYHRRTMIRHILCAIHLEYYKKLGLHKLETKLAALKESFYFLSTHLSGLRKATVEIIFMGDTLKLEPGDIAGLIWHSTEVLMPRLELELHPSTAKDPKKVAVFDCCQKEIEVYPKETVREEVVGEHRQ